MTYWGLNAVFLAVVAAAVVLAAVRRRMRWRAVAVTLGVVLAATAVFDNVMIGVGLVAYDPDRISGAFLGIAPLEDFAYAIAAALLLPALWGLLPRRARPERAASERAASERAASERLERTDLKDDLP
ncbi:lycopene cyclase domain-containing protein [Microbacteriaceae bacterium VKM Ac-2855]|nr:lycopene cyclase domain-containing protein [Microbacteriaceae bacterium VKM Ac-2855]